MSKHRAGGRAARVLVVAGLLAVPLVDGGTARAAVGPGENTGTGYAVTVQVTYTGDVKGGAGTRSESVPASCWWEPAAAQYRDTEAMLAWYQEVTSGNEGTVGNYDNYGPVQVWMDAVTREEQGENLAWYRARCIKPADYEQYDLPSVEEGGGLLGGGVGFVVYMYNAFDEAGGPPPPRVDPEELARLARERIDIPLPAVERNPQIGGAGGATLVRLPTWFTVDADAVQQHEITASIPGSPVTATVTALTQQLQLRSPAGSADCSPAAAVVAYGQEGASDDTACTVQFSRASTGGPYTVTSRTQWTATWQGVDADGAADGGDLEGLVVEDTTSVPVAEVQNIVTR